jgi:hypothetical protein
VIGENICVLHKCVGSSHSVGRAGLTAWTDVTDVASVCTAFAGALESLQRCQLCLNLIDQGLVVDMMDVLISLAGLWWKTSWLSAQAISPDMQPLWDAAAASRVTSAKSMARWMH